MDNFSLPSSLVSKPVMPAFEQGKSVRVYMAAKEHLICVQEPLLWFWKTKCGLDVR
jgi:hypothetical protein